MEFTGERPFDGQELQSSRLRYKAVLPYCIGKRVLDFGCGVGYGSFFLSHFACQVAGYDKSEEAVEIARKTLKKENLQFSSTLELVDIDMIVAVEVIEHLEEEELLYLLNKFCAVKTFVCTTPNGNIFPYNPTKTGVVLKGYHKRHYSAAELVEMFKKYYKFVDVSGCALDSNIKVHGAPFNLYTANYTGHTVFATNSIEWDDGWLNKIRIEDLTGLTK